jgi:hypothetical protein
MDSLSSLPAGVAGGRARPAQWVRFAHFGLIRNRVLLNSGNTVGISLAKGVPACYSNLGFFGRAVHIRFCCGGHVAQGD